MVLVELVAEEEAVRAMGMVDMGDIAVEAIKVLVEEVAEALESIEYLELPTLIKADMGLMAL